MITVGGGEALSAAMVVAACTHRASLYTFSACFLEQQIRLESGSLPRGM